MAEEKNNISRTILQHANGFRIINAYQCFLTLNTLIDEVNRELGHEKICK